LTIPRRDLLQALATLASAHVSRRARGSLSFIEDIGCLRQNPDPSAILRAPLPPRENEQGRVAAAVRRATAAIALLKQDKPDLVWPLLAFDEDPTTRSYVIRGCAQGGVRAGLLTDRLRADGLPPSERQALILALGGFRGAALPATLRSAMLPLLLDSYSQDPDPGVHSALGWLLRPPLSPLLRPRLDWGARRAVLEASTDLPSSPKAGSGWFATSSGFTMVCHRGQPLFTMGSPTYERDRFPDEQPHQVRIPRDFAVATTETTVQQFGMFLRETPGAKARHDTEVSARFARPQVLAPTPDGPVVAVTWYEAVQYCNWLNRREGIPQEEWCFPEGDFLSSGMQLPPDYLTRIGYRLPTEAEWEFVARAGTTTSRFFGLARDLIPDYVWYSDNSHDQHTLPVGCLKPNGFGLFDMLGNAWEWCLDRRTPYPTDFAAPATDIEETLLVVDDATPRTRRGGSFTYDAASVRAACRGDVTYFPMQRRDSVGFRIARTLRLA
jgi:formylglycine-generating enzyme required for sulfatase activity